jgi:hypothetical protein
MYVKCKVYGRCIGTTLPRPAIFLALLTFNGPASPRPISVVTFASLGYPRSLFPTSSKRFCLFVRLCERVRNVAEKTKPEAIAAGFLFVGTTRFEYRMQMPVYKLTVNYFSDQLT